VQGHFKTASEIADFAKMLGGNAAAPISGPPRGGNHEVLDGPSLHVDEHFFEEIVVEELAGALCPLFWC
jgi:hypothetical protein